MRGFKILILILIISLCTCSCQVVKKTENHIDITPTDELVVYIPPHSSFWINPIISEYKDQDIRKEGYTYVLDSPIDNKLMNKCINKIFKESE